jgi:putative phage-type endonuclease
MKEDINKKDLEFIIDDILSSHDLTNDDLYCDETYGEIFELVVECYNQINKYNPCKEIDVFNLGDLKNIFDSKYETKLYDTISDLLDSRITVESSGYNSDDISNLTEKIKHLESIPQPAQRTKEWYIFRGGRITASDFGTVLETNPYSSREKLIMKKCGVEMPFIPGPAIIHGVKYEDVAVAIYEKRNSVNIKEYGCIPHPTISYLGASPDGICYYDSENRNYIGRMLEIKCPKSRKLNGFVPEYYLAQVQGQLEVCDLEFCDFLECNLYEVSKTDFFKNNHTSLNYYDNSKYKSNYSTPTMEQGVLIDTYCKELNKNIYHYAPFSVSETKEGIKKWEESIIDKVLADDNLEYNATKYWRLKEYSVIFVKRDRPWFKKAQKKLEKCWNEILHYRQVGIDKMEIKKKTTRKKAPVVAIKEKISVENKYKANPKAKAKPKSASSKNGFLSDSD